MAPSPAASAGASGAAGDLTEVSLQLQWAPQAQFAGYFAADRQGFFEKQGLKVNLLPGGPTVDNQTVGSDPNGPEFTIAWVPKVLVLRDKGQSDLVDIAQVFQRSGTREVSWKATNISSPADWKGKKVGVWDFGNDYEVIAAARKQTPPRSRNRLRTRHPGLQHVGPPQQGDRYGRGDDLQRIRAGARGQEP